MHFIGNGVHLVLNAFFFSFYYFILIFARGKKNDFTSTVHSGRYDERF